MTYTITITSTAAARAHAAQKGYNLVFAKGVITGGGTDYNMAWFVLGPTEISDTTAVSWEAKYEASYTAEATMINGATVNATGNTIELQLGGCYQVDSTGTLGPDPNMVSNPRSPAVHFFNSAGYANEYTPVLFTQGPNLGDVMVPFWAAETGVTINGEISALPLEVVRVWLGKYDAGTTVNAHYYSGTQVVEFDLTANNIRDAAATINDDLSEWVDLTNARTIDSYSAVLVAEEKAVQVLPNSLEFMVHAPVDSLDTRHSDHAHTPRRQCSKS